MRPRKSYVIFDNGAPALICEGLTEARLHVQRIELNGTPASYRPCRDRSAAEVYLDWWHRESESKRQQKRQQAQPQERFDQSV